MKIKRLLALLLAVVCLLSFAACAKDVEKEPVDESTISTDEIDQSYMVTQGTVLEIYDTYVLIQPLSGDPAAASADRIEVALQGTITWEDKQVGDVIEVEYRDGIQETYPARIANVISITLLGNGTNIAPDEQQPEAPGSNDPTNEPVDFDFDMTFEFEPYELYNDDCVVFDMVDVFYDEDKGFVFQAKVYEINNDRKLYAAFDIIINGQSIDDFSSKRMDDNLTIEWTVYNETLAKYDIKNVKSLQLTNVAITPFMDEALLAGGFDIDVIVYNDGVASVQVETVIFNNTEYNKKDLSEETLQWIEWYNSLTGEEQLAVDSFPAELTE